MKMGYKRLLVFETIFLIILVLNSFVNNVLSGYKMVIFLLASIVIFKLFFGIEKDRHRYIKDIILEVIIYLIFFLLFYYLIGVIIGFAKSDNYYTWYGFNTFIIPLTCIILLKEFLRYIILCKAEGSKLAIFITIILFILLDISSALYYGNFSNGYGVFMFIAMTLLPAISSNIVYSYMTYKVGYKPIIVYELIASLYPYLIPIVPNPNEYIVSIINLLLPLVLAFRIYLFFKKDADEEIERKNRDKGSYISLGLATVFVIIIVYFTSGLFHYQAIAVASGSMMPVIYKGDVVIVEKIDGKFDNLEVGQVIAYMYDDLIVVHRLVNIIYDQGEYYFYTKGDANNDIDNFIIKEDMIVGVVNLKIPYVGLPTVWLNNL